MTFVGDKRDWQLGLRKQCWVFDQAQEWWIIDQEKCDRNSPPLKKESVGIRRSHAERCGVLCAECCALKSVRPAHVTEDSGVRSYAGRNSGYQQMVGAVGTNQDEEGSLRRSKGVGRAVSEAE